MQRFSYHCQIPRLHGSSSSKPRLPTSIPPPPHFHCLLNLDHEPRACCLSRALLGIRIWCFWSSGWHPQHKVRQPAPSVFYSWPQLFGRKSCNHTRDDCRSQWPKILNSMFTNGIKSIHPQPFDLFQHSPTAVYCLPSLSSCLPTVAHSWRMASSAPSVFPELKIFRKLPLPHKAETMILKKLKTLNSKTLVPPTPFLGLFYPTPCENCPMLYFSSLHNVQSIIYLVPSALSQFLFYKRKAITTKPKMFPEIQINSLPRGEAVKYNLGEGHRL